MNIVEQILTVSPWLKQGDWESEDRHLKRVKKSGIRYRHTHRAISFSPDTISIIRGSRQIGKSTECKLMIQSRIEEGEDPARFIYFPCDNLLSRRELIEVITTANEIANKSDVVHLTLFLDEITSVKQWYKSIKWAADAGLLSGVALVLTGSSAFEMRRGYERMPGRRGGGRDICLLPMDLTSFIRCIDGFEVPKISLRAMIESEHEFNRNKAILSEHQSVLKRFLDTYLHIGGFPLAVSEHATRAAISEESKETIISAISSEIEKQKRSTETLRLILNALHTAQTNPVSLTHIASSQNIPSAATVKEYLELLHSSFVCFPVSALDISKKRPFPKKDKKYFFADPFFIAAIETFLHSDDWAVPHRAESAVAAALVRRFSGQWARWGYVDSLYYWRSTSNNEIDFVIDVDGRFFGVEVKYQTRVSGWDEMSIIKGIGRGILVTKDDFSYGKAPRIPLWAFLTMSLIDDQ